jgi:hypothetical protein
MEYTIISQNDNQTLIKVTIDEVEYQSLIVCGDTELDEAVNSFINSIKNPIQPS